MAKIKGTSVASSFLYDEFQRLAASEMNLSVLTALICGFSLDPLLFSEYSGYLTYYYNVMLSILNLFVSTYLFMCALLSDCPKPNNVQPCDKP